MASGITRDKRPLDEGACSASKAARVENTFSSLPIETLQNIVKYLPDADLAKIAQVDSACRKVALHERVVRVFTAFPRKLEQLAAEFHLPGGAIATQNVAERCLALKKTLRQDVDNKVISLSDIDQAAQQLKEALVAQKLIGSIEGSPLPVLTRGTVVYKAATKGLLEIVRVLLANGPISEEARGFAVIDAARSGDLEILNDLLANGPISEETRGLAVSNAAGSGYLEIVNDLLANGPISEEARGLAVRDAARYGCLGIVQALLAIGAISIVDRSQAIASSIQAGHYRIASELLPAKAILMPAFLGLAASYINSLQYQEEK